MWSLDMPSQIKFEMPDWLGGVQRYAGGIEDSSKAIWQEGVAYIDPIEKAAGDIAKVTSAKISSGAAAARDAAEAPFKWTWNGITGLFSGVQTGLKWAVFVIVLGVAIYALAVISPFIPKPGAK